LLQPQRDSREAIESKIREIGSRLWAAQYQQNPTPAEGNMIKAAWLARYDFSAAERKFRRIVLSCDPSGKGMTFQFGSADWLFMKATDAFSIHA